MEYLDLTRSASLTFENQKHIYSNAYTMGFWFLSSSKDLEQQVIRLTYEDNMMVTLSTNSGNINAHCFLGLEYHDILGKTTSSTTASNAVNNFYASSDAGNINMLKTANPIQEKKWHHIRCAYSYDNMKFYLEANKEGYPSTPTTPSTLNMPHYYRSKALKMPIMKIYSSAPKLTITRPAFLSSSVKSVFIRNFVWFADYIPPSVYFQY